MPQKDGTGPRGQEKSTVGSCRGRGPCGQGGQGERGGQAGSGGQRRGRKGARNGESSGRPG